MIFHCLLWTFLDISFPPQEASVETNELRHHENIIEEDSPTNNVTSEVLSVDEAIKDNTDSANNDQLDRNKDDNAFKESENLDDTEKDKRPRLGKKLHSFIFV